MTVGRSETLHFELDVEEEGILAADCKRSCVQPNEMMKEEGSRRLPEPRINPVMEGADRKTRGDFGGSEESVGRVIIDGPEEPGIYASLDNRHLKSILKPRKLNDEVMSSVKDRYLAGASYYLLL